jgi:hypothetical protein
VSVTDDGRPETRMIYTHWVDLVNRASVVDYRDWEPRYVGLWWKETIGCDVYGYTLWIHTDSEEAQARIQACEAARQLETVERAVVGLVAALRSVQRIPGTDLAVIVQEAIRRSEEK